MVASVSFDSKADLYYPDLVLYLLGQSLMQVLAHMNSPALGVDLELGNKSPSLVQSPYSL